MRFDNVPHFRRKAVKASLASIGGVHAATAATGASAAGLPRLDESDPTASAFAYAKDARTVGADARGGADRVCATCRLYAQASEQWGPCTLFPGKAVAAQGWCKCWVARS